MDVPRREHDACEEDDEEAGREEDDDEEEGGEEDRQEVATAHFIAQRRGRLRAAAAFCGS
jgi:hypothetical protein